MILQTLFWFCAAVILAALEIEIEGKYGWAERLPTWYRTTGPAARAFGFLSSGKPLTGYHLFLHLFMLLLFHMPFFYGVPWTAALELLQIAYFIGFWVVEDAAWFILNPNYEGRVLKDDVWWFAKSRWVMGEVPRDYLVGAGLVTALLTAAVILRSATLLQGIATALCIITMNLLFLMILSSFSASYRSWYYRMRETDDRDKAGIFHND